MPEILAYYRGDPTRSSKGGQQTHCCKSGTRHCCLGRKQQSSWGLPGDGLKKTGDDCFIAPSSFFKYNLYQIFFLSRRPYDVWWEEKKLIRAHSHGSVAQKMSFRFCSDFVETIFSHNFQSKQIFQTKDTGILKCCGAPTYRRSWKWA